MTYMEIIKNYIKDNYKLYPPKKGEPPLEPSIYYMNGNDSTQFDWDMNDRTCEFFIFYNSKRQLGYMKVYATKRGTLEGYVFDTERYSNGVQLKPAYIGEGKARAIKSWCMLWDKENAWDQVIGDIDL